MKFFCNFFVDNVNKIEIAISKTDRAFTTGETPNLIIEYILSGRVEEPGPETKKVITKSSKDNVNAIKNADIIAGNNIGIITFVKVCLFVAPKS